jgi:hypothetical protein
MLHGGFGRPCKSLKMLGTVLRRMRHEIGAFIPQLVQAEKAIVENQSHSTREQDDGDRRGEAPGQQVLGAGLKCSESMGCGPAPSGGCPVECREQAAQCRRRLLARTKQSAASEKALSSLLLPLRHGADSPRQIIQRQPSKLFSDAGFNALESKQRTSFGQLPVVLRRQHYVQPPCDRRSLD